MQRTILFLFKDPKDQPDFGSDVKKFYVASSPNSQHALQALAHQPYDAVVADIEFQNQGDISFFDQVMNRHPKVNRIALCHPAGSDPVKSSASIHQYVEKPCQAKDILVAMERAQLLDKWLLNLKIKRLFKLLTKLPSVPTVYFRLVKILQSPQAELESIGDLVATDPSLTTKTLQVVNSALFGLGRKITCTTEAVGFLGVERIKALAMATHTFSHFKSDLESIFSIEKLWQHCLRTGTLAQTIAREETGDSKLAEEAFTAGVLHDIGKMIVAANLPAEIKRTVQKARAKDLAFYEAELEILEATHAEIGACILGSWGIPSVIVEAIAFHHTPEQYFEDKFSSTTVLHLADYLEHESTSNPDVKYPQRLNLEYLDKFGLKERLEDWQKFVSESAVAA